MLTRTATITTLTCPLRLHLPALRTKMMLVVAPLCKDDDENGGCMENELMKFEEDERRFAQLYKELTQMRDSELTF